MTPRFALLAGAAAIHLVLVACSAAHIRLLSVDTPAGDSLAGYEALSGSDNTFAFFAPGVAPQFRAEFTLTDNDGHTWQETSEQGTTREANLRYDSMTSMFTFKRLRRHVAASWAAALFGRYPNATQVELVVEAQAMPTMDGYRDGFEPEWDSIYERAFSR